MSPIAFLFVFVSSIVFLTEIRTEIPDYIHVCKSTEKDVSNCILNSVNLLKPRLIEGIPELEVPPLEPLLLDEIKLRNGPTRTRIAANITNIKVWGASNFKILDLKANLDKNRFFFKVRLPRLHFEGNYDLDMQILVLKLTGKGPITGNFTDYEFEALMKGNVIEKEGKRYENFEKMRIKIRIGEAKLNLENLFGQSSVLGKVSNDVISENAELFLGEIRPNLESSLAEKFTEIANKITSRFTYEELFP